MGRKLREAGGDAAAKSQAIMTNKPKINKPKPQEAVLLSSDSDDLALITSRSAGKAKERPATKRSKGKRSSAPLRQSAIMSQGRRSRFVYAEDEDSEEGSVIGKASGSGITGVVKQKSRAGSPDEDDDDFPPIKVKASKNTSTHHKRPYTSATSSSKRTSEDRDDDLPVARPTRKKRRVAAARIDPEDSSDNDLPIAPSYTVRRRAKPPRVMTDSDDEENPTFSCTLHSAAGEKSGGSLLGSDPARSAPLASSQLRSSAKKNPRALARQRAQELLRRRRAGEVINDDDLTESEGEQEETRGIYDSDNEPKCLVEFPDDDESFPHEDDPVRVTNRKKMKGKEKALGNEEVQNGHSDTESSHAGTNSDLSDFIVDSNDGPLGAPSEVLLGMPLQFTSVAHKKLKDHFHSAVEWLVFKSLEPEFVERRDDVYKIAWQKLDDEVSGLAQSKFTSSAWKPDFVTVLRSRPLSESVALLQEDAAQKNDTCDACGRANHPAKHTIYFDGRPYYKNFMSAHFLETIEEVELENGTIADVDEHDNILPSLDQRWAVGSVCNNNAKMAHKLLHWRRALFDWVDAKLMAQGYLDGAGKRVDAAHSKKKRKSAEYQKKMYDLVDSILIEWTDKGTLDVLYREFKKIVEESHHMGTDGKRIRHR